MERFSRLKERISLPVEAVLWRQILETNEARSLLENTASPIITLVGTNPKLSLAEQIFASHPEAQIIIIEKDPQVVQKAREHNLASQLVIYEGNILNLNQAGVEESSQDIVIAKHLIHLVEPLSLVAHVAPLIKKGGLFFTSAPPVYDYLTSQKLNKDRQEQEKSGLILFRKEPLKGFWGGTLFGFVKGEPNSSINLQPRRVPAPRLAF